GPVTIGLNPAQSGVLGGTLTVNAVKGVADFSDLTMNQVGTGYTLQVTSTGLNPVTTNPFNVVLPATALQVTTQPPASIGAGTSFGLPASPIDSQGNVDTP